MESALTVASEACRTRTERATEHLDFVKPSGTRKQHPDASPQRTPALPGLLQLDRSSHETVRSRLFAGPSLASRSGIPRLEPVVRPFVEVPGLERGRSNRDGFSPMT